MYYIIEILERKTFIEDVFFLFLYSVRYSSSRFVSIEFKVKCVYSSWCRCFNSRHDSIDDYTEKLCRSKKKPTHEAFVSMLLMRMTHAAKTL